MQHDPESAEARCEEEPIRIPGSVQQHGFFLLTDNAFSEVLVASENAERYLGLPLKLILGGRLDALLSRELLSSLHLLASGSSAESHELVTFLGSFQIHGELFSVMTHCLDGRRAVEFERLERLVGPEMMNGVITNFVAKLSRLENEGDLCNALTEQVAELTGFDRVLLYSFNQEGHGTVLSEVNNGRLPNYLGLRFPFTDIPQQARDLYVLNTVRIIPDANYTPSPLAGPARLAPAALDLSLSVLRSVSPVHLQYMRNMGTMSSMSISIVTEGRLWGLISGHHSEPKAVPYLIRSASDMLTRMGANQLASFATAARLRQTVHFHAVQRNVLTQLAGEPNFLDGLVHQLPTLSEVTGAAAVALLVDGHFTCHGELPGEAALNTIADWLDDQPEREVFVTSHFTADAPSLQGVEDMREYASGLLAVRISSVRRRYLLWFRPEVITTVRWAGDPVEANQEAKSLHPRSSFDEWKQLVRGRSEPWSAMEVDSARDFRAALTTIGLRRAEEAVELGEARFQKLTQALPMKVFTADDAGRLTYVNSRWERTGLSGTGQWFEVSSLHPDDVELCQQRWRQSVEDGSPFEAEVRLMGDGHGQRWNFVRVVPFQRAGAQRAGWIGTFIDLTESKERETALRMSEKLALTGRMTSVIAHEINNPLEAITNLMYLLRSEYHAEGPATSYIGMVESELERISGITKQTLRWNRDPTDQRDSFNVGSLIDDVLRLFAGKIRNRQITVRTSGDRSLVISGVLGQVRQVLANLVSNAIDAAPVGGHVSVTAVGSGDEVGFAVHDDGAGIDHEVRDRLFEPFHSTKGDLGNGLGLYISKEIVERHHGHIEVHSEPGQGTTMTVRLPSVVTA